MNTASRSHRTIVLALLALLASVDPSGARCVGDCDGDGRVSIAEVIRGIVVLPIQPPSDILECFGVAGGESLSISHLIRAIGNALNACPPTATTTPTATPTATPEPVEAGVMFDPPGLSPRKQVLVQFEECATSFDLRLSNGGAPGSSYTVGDLRMWHGYSQGDYGFGFSWSLDGITFPVVLRNDTELVIPISYTAEAFDSRLHVAVNASGPGDFGEYHAIFRGRSGTTCHRP